MKNVYMEEEQVCEMFGVSSEYLEKLRKKGKGPKFIQLKNIFLYPEDDTKVWFSNKR